MLLLLLLDVWLLDLSRNVEILHIGIDLEVNGCVVHLCLISIFASIHHLVARLRLVRPAIIDTGLIMHLILIDVTVCLMNHTLLWLLNV